MSALGLQQSKEQEPRKKRWSSSSCVHCRDPN